MLVKKLSCEKSEAGGSGTQYATSAEGNAICRLALLRLSLAVHHIVPRRSGVVVGAGWGGRWGVNTTSPGMSGKGKGRVKVRQR